MEAPPLDADKDQDEHLANIARYYARSESRIGYRALLRGAKHFGFYRPGDRTFPFSHSLKRMEERIGDEVGLPPGSLVLDAGCGAGDVAVHLAATRGLDVTGIDILEEDLTQARRKAAAAGISSAARFVRMSYTRLAFPDERFDGIYTVESLAHAEDPVSVLSEFWRVLKPGGRIAAFEYSHSKLSSMPPRGRHMLVAVNRATAMPGFQRFEHGLLAEDLRHTGFTDVSTEDITANMIPMIRAFAVMAAPWYFTVGVLARRKDKVPNAMAAVEFWRYRKYLRYTIVTAQKPTTAS